MNLETTIEIPKKEDVIEITRVQYEAWLATYPNEIIGITKDDIEYRYKDAFNLENIEKKAEVILNCEQNEKVLVAKYDNKVIGFCYVVKESDHNKLEAMYILPAFHNMGVGTRLWKNIESFFDKTKDTYLTVAEYNNKAISFYNKIGFISTNKSILDERFRMRSGAIMPEIEMVLKAGK